MVCAWAMVPMRSAATASRTRMSWFPVERARTLGRHHDNHIAVTNTKIQATYHRRRHRHCDGCCCVLEIALASAGRRTCGPASELRLDPRCPQRAVADVLQGYRHHLGVAVDDDMAKELRAEARRQVFALRGAASFLEM